MAKLIDQPDKYYREHIIHQYDRSSGSAERMYYPQIVHYMDNSRREKPPSKPKKRSRPKNRDKNIVTPLPAEPSSKDEEGENNVNGDENGFVEGVESLLRTKSKSKHCDVFGNHVNKIDYAIYDGEEFQQEKSDTKSLFQRVEERDDSGKTTVLYLTSPKKDKKSPPKVKTKRNTYSHSVLSPGAYIDDGEEKRNLIYETCYNKNKQNRDKNEMEEATKKLIDGTKMTNDEVKNIADSDKSPLKSDRQESIIETKSPRKHQKKESKDLCDDGDCSDLRGKVQEKNEEQQLKPLSSQDSNSNRRDFDPISDLPERVKKKKKRKKKSKNRTLFSLGNNPEAIRYESDSDEERKRRKRERRRERKKEKEMEKNNSQVLTQPIPPVGDVMNEQMLSDNLTCSEGSASLASESDASSTDISLKTEGHLCHRSKSESSVCESITSKPKKQFSVTERQPRSFNNMFQSSRSMSENRGLFNKLSQTVGNCLTNIAMNHGRFNFPRRQHLYVPDVGMGSNWLKAKCKKDNAAKFFPKETGGHHGFENTKVNVIGESETREVRIRHTVQAGEDVEADLVLKQGSKVTVIADVDYPIWPIEHQDRKQGLSQELQNESDGGYKKSGHYSRWDTLNHKRSTSGCSLEENQSFNKSDCLTSDDSLFGDELEINPRPRHRDLYNQEFERVPYKIARSKQSKSHFEDHSRDSGSSRNFDQCQDSWASRGQQIQTNRSTINKEETTNKSLSRNNLSDKRNILKRSSTMPNKNRETSRSKNGSVTTEKPNTQDGSEEESDSNTENRNKPRQRSTRVKQARQEVTRGHDRGHMRLLPSWDVHESRTEKTNRDARYRQVSTDRSNVSRSNRRALPSGKLKRDDELSIGALVVDNLGFVYECVELNDKNDRKRPQRFYKSIQQGHKNKKIMKSLNQRNDHAICKSSSSYEVAYYETDLKGNSNEIQDNPSRNPQRSTTVKNVSSKDNNCSNRDRSDSNVLEFKATIEKPADEPHIYQDNCDKRINNIETSRSQQSSNFENIEMDSSLEKEIKSNANSENDITIADDRYIYNDLLELKNDVDRLSGLSESILAKTRGRMQYLSNENDEIQVSIRKDKQSDDLDYSSSSMSKGLLGVASLHNKACTSERPSLTFRPEAGTKATTVGISKGSVKVFSTPDGSKWHKVEAEKGKGVHMQSDCVQTVEISARKRAISRSYRQANIDEETNHDVKPKKNHASTAKTRDFNDFMGEKGDDWLNDNRSASTIHERNLFIPETYDGRITQVIHSQPTGKGYQGQSLEKDKIGDINHKVSIDRFDKMITPEQPASILNKEIGYSKTFIEECMSRLNENYSTNNKSNKIAKNQPNRVRCQSTYHDDAFNTKCPQSRESSNNISKYRCRRSTGNINVYSKLNTFDNIDDRAIKEDLMQTEYHGEKIHDSLSCLYVEPLNTVSYLSKNQNSSSFAPMSLDKIRRDIFYPELAYNCSLSKKFQKTNSYVEKIANHCNEEGDSRKENMNRPSFSNSFVVFDDRGKCNSFADLTLSSISTKYGDGIENNPEINQTFLLFSNNIQSWQAWSHSWISKLRLGVTKIRGFEGENNISASRSCSLLPKLVEQPQTSCILESNSAFYKRSKSDLRTSRHELRRSKRQMNPTSRSIQSCKEARKVPSSNFEYYRPSNDVSTWTGSQLSSAESNTSLVPDEEEYSDNESTFVGANSEVFEGTIDPYVNSRLKCGICHNTEETKDVYKEERDVSVNTCNSEYDSPVSSSSISSPNNEPRCYTTRNISPRKSLKRSKFCHGDIEVNKSCNHVKSASVLNDSDCSDSTCQSANNADTSLTVFVVTKSSPKRTKSSLTVECTTERSLGNDKSNSLPVKLAGSTDAAIVSLLEGKPPVVLYQRPDKNTVDSELDDNLDATYCSNITENNSNQKDSPSVKSLLDGKLKIVYDQKSNKWLSGARKNQSLPLKHTNKRLQTSKSIKWQTIDIDKKQEKSNVDYDSAPGRVQSLKGSRGKDSVFFAWFKERISKDLCLYSNSQEGAMTQLNSLLPKQTKRTARNINMSKSEDESSGSELVAYHSRKTRKRRNDIMKNSRHRHEKRNRRRSNITLSTTSLMTQLSQSVIDSAPDMIEFNSLSETLADDNQYYSEDLPQEGQEVIRPSRIPANSFANVSGFGRLVHRMGCSPEYHKIPSLNQKLSPPDFSDEQQNEAPRQTLAPILEESCTDHIDDTNETGSVGRAYAVNCSTQCSTSPKSFNECYEESVISSPDFNVDEFTSCDERDRSFNKTENNATDVKQITTDQYDPPADCQEQERCYFTMLPEDQLNKTERCRTVNCSKTRDSSTAPETSFLYTNTTDMGANKFITTRFDQGQEKNVYKSDFMKNEIREHYFSNPCTTRDSFDKPYSQLMGKYLDSTQSNAGYYPKCYTSSQRVTSSLMPNHTMRYRSSLGFDGSYKNKSMYTACQSTNYPSSRTYKNLFLHSTTRSTTRIHPRTTPSLHSTAFDTRNNSCKRYSGSRSQIFPKNTNCNKYLSEDFLKSNFNQNANNGDDDHHGNSAHSMFLGASSKSNTSSYSDYQFSGGISYSTRSKNTKQTHPKEKRGAFVQCYNKPASRVNSHITDGYILSNNFALCAGKNINGSGNMVGSIPHYSQVSQSLGYPLSAEELHMSCGEEMTPPGAHHQMCEIDALSDTVVVQTASGLQLSSVRSEKDVTGNHPSTSSRYVSDFCAPRTVSRDDIRMKMSPCCPQTTDTFRKHTDHRSGYADDQRFKYSDTFRKIKDNYMVGSQTCIAVPTMQSLEIQRTFRGQGDTSTKQDLTEWYVNDMGVGDHVDVGPRRDRSACIQLSKSEISSEGSMESMESFSSRSHSSESSIREMEERVANMSHDDNESKESSEYEFDGVERINEADEESDVDDEEDDDDEWEDESDEECADHATGCCAVSYAIMNSRDNRNIVKEMAKMNNAICQNCCYDGQDITNNKQNSRMDVDRSGPLTHGMIKTAKERYEPGPEDKRRQEHDSGAYGDTQFETNDQLSVAHSKSKSVSQRFSFDKIKVPSIEKERVRFACSEKGEWAEIGRGSYGCVYLGLLDGSVEVAIKDFYESSAWDLVIHEARMLLFLQETGITPVFYGLRRRFNETKEPSEYCIIMEYFGDGRTLFNVMSDKILLAPEEWLDVVGQLVAGLRLIHSKQVLINDLKADNILIDLSSGRKTIRYIDVGMATYKQGLTFQLPTDQMNKYNFLAPEVREGAHTSTKSDIYSLGYMLDQIMRLAGPALAGLEKLVGRCLDKNPDNRPDIDEIVSQVHWYIVTKSHTREVSPHAKIFACNSV